MTLEKGILRLSRAGSAQIEVPTKNGGTAILIPSQDEVSRTLLDRLAEFAGKEVDFERVGGQLRQVREAGGVFASPHSSERGRAQPSRDGRREPDPSHSRQDRRSERPTRPMSFHNPYNFIPAPPRNTTDPDLGDRSPERHGVLHPHLYSGSIRVRMMAKTPLLVLDTESVQTSPNGHKTYPLRVDDQGNPLIPASSVRGMLRSAYEAVTNSRFGCFSESEQSDRLAFRMDARDSLNLIPARVEGGQIHLLTGTSSVNSDGKPTGPMYAAWLPRYRNGQEDPNAVRCADGTLPTHGEEVHCWIERMLHSSPTFSYWRVREVDRAGNLGPHPIPSKNGSKSAPATPSEMRRVRGWVCVTNANINRKHDERVFFGDVASAPGPYPVTEGHRQLWRELIQNYQSIHAKDLGARRARNQQPEDYLGSEPGQTAWSRHVHTEADRELSDGTLCYVRLNSKRSDVVAIFPVMIARELYPASPWDLLPESLRPAASIGQLSPADRVFGWVKPDQNGSLLAREEQIATRTLLRVSSVRCESSLSDAVETFAPPGVPLAILSAPKPQQGRFYVAQSLNGAAHMDQLSRQNAGYASGKGLRGRKVYPHQQGLPDGHWVDSSSDRTQEAVPHRQEYRRPRKNGQEQRDDQNRSILGWVKPNAQFSFELHVQNVSTVELGALLWCLNLPDDHFFRFGGGKPLGFGSVQLDVMSLDVRTGDGLAARYSEWNHRSSPNDPKVVALQAFQDAVMRAYPPSASGFHSVNFIAAFLSACRGHQDNLPVHYPRATANGLPGPPSPDGESFKWFVSNERNDAQYALKDLVGDSGLPTLEERPGGGAPRQGNGQQRRGPYGGHRPGR